MSYRLLGALSSAIFIAGCLASAHGAVVAAGRHPESRPLAVSTLRKCTPAALTSAVTRGGVINVACSGVVALRKTLVIGKSKNVNINATRYHLFLTFKSSKAGVHRIFWVKGGRLTLTSLTIENVTSSGKSTRDGANGQAGDDGADATAAGATGGSATPGGNGEHPKDATGVTGGWYVYPTAAPPLSLPIRTCISAGLWGATGAGEDQEEVEARAAPVARVLMGARTV